VEDSTGNIDKVIKIDEARVREHLGELVRGSVEDTLNSLLDAEADRLCNAKRYERTEGRRDTRAGHYSVGELREVLANGDDAERIRLLAKILR